MVKAVDLATWRSNVPVVGQGTAGLKVLHLVFQERVDTKQLLPRLQEKRADDEYKDILSL